MPFFAISVQVGEKKKRNPPPGTIFYKGGQINMFFFKKKVLNVGVMSVSERSGDEYAALICAGLFSGY
jgi:hypothetical protein